MRLENVTSTEFEYTKQGGERLQPNSVVIEFANTSLDVLNVLQEMDWGY